MNVAAECAVVSFMGAAQMNFEKLSTATIANSKPSSVFVNGPKTSTLPSSKRDFTDNEARAVGGGTWCSKCNFWHSAHVSDTRLKSLLHADVSS